MGELQEVTAEDAQQLKQEHDEVNKLLDKQLKNNDSWYIIDKRWFDQWKKYINSLSYSTMEHPGPIDNAALFLDDSSNELKEHLLEGVDYKVVPAEAWKILVARFHVTEDKSYVERKVIEEGMFVKDQVVEIYPIPLKLCNHLNQETVVKKFSRVLTIDKLDKEMRTLFQIPSSNETRIWNAFDKDDYQEMKKNDTIQSNSLQKNQLVVLESKKPEEEWKLSGNKKKTVHVNGSSYSSNANSASSSTGNSYQLRNSTPTDFYGKKRLTPGLCGLNNLGNTCFMNSALQCLSNVPYLTNYFKGVNLLAAASYTKRRPLTFSRMKNEVLCLENEFRRDLNVNNPLGMHGKIAATYANLIQTIWSGENGSTAPREFKYAVGQFQPRFVGYQQQDSQELMAFLIDGLHEDLNRISKKPYIEAKDADGRPHELVAQEAWRNHRKRNDSVIVDTLHGLFLSKVDCPECPRISVTFDPFCYLTLPLPVKKDKNLDLTFVPLDFNEEMVKYRVNVPKNGAIDDVRMAVSKCSSKPSNQMVVTDVYNNRFHKVFQPSDPIRNIYDKDIIYVFEKPAEANVIPVYLRFISETGGCVLFGIPLLVPVFGDTVPYLRLYRIILKQVTRFIADDALRSVILNFLHLDEEEAAAELKEHCNPSEEPKEKSIREVLNLFTIKSVNSFGSQEFKRFSFDDDKPIKISEFIHLAADWNKNACEKHFTDRWDELVQVHESMRPTAIKKQCGVNLTSCVELFTLKEQLGKDNTWYCSNCKKHQQAFKKFDLWMLPPVLIIHLKRFASNRMNRDKLDTFVDFPVRDLDLTDFIVNPNKDKLPENKRRYNLIAVSNHYGGMGGGHYTAFAKNKLDKQWHYFDDSSVSLSSEDRVVTKAAYMLVYQRQDLEEWLENKSGQPFPFLEPIFSPRAMNVDSDSPNGSSFQFRPSNDEDVLNNNAEDAMDTS